MTDTHIVLKGYKLAEHLKEDLKKLLWEWIGEIAGEQIEIREMDK